MDSSVFVSRLWPGLSKATIRQPHYEHFLSYIESSLKQNFSPNTAATDLKYICMILDHVRTLPAIDQSPRNAIVAKLRTEHPTSWQDQDDESMAKYVAICYSLRLTIDIGLKANNGISRTTSLRWDGDQSISNVIFSVFPVTDNTIENEKIDQNLTLEYLSQSGYRVLFVDDLADHLVVQRTGGQPWLLVYQHKIFLKNELHFGSLLPRPLVEEALHTLNLLLPYHESKTQSFLKKNSMQDLETLGPCVGSPKTDLSDYKYFRTRLAYLCTVIKDEPPPGIQQILPGRHGSNLREFLNFWIAAFVGGLTIFSIAFGITALVYAKWAYDIALLQYQLSLAQACADPNATEQLPSFC